MNAIIYKFKQLIKCNQIYNYCCNSSNGLISLQSKNKHTSNLVPDPIYNIYQKNLLYNKRFSPVKKIATWNIQELWWHCYSGHKIYNIIKYISRSDADVFCLQEVFEPEVRVLITQHPLIIKKYPYFITGNLCNRYIIGENSGLLVLSSQPIVLKQFTPFCRSYIPDIFASKGALYFTIGEINIITTHLQSGNIPLAFNQLSHLLKNSPFVDKTILIGDLNIPNPFTALKLDKNNIQHTHVSGRTLDHIIPVNNDIAFSLKVDYINLKNTSDHWPVIATIN